MKTELFKEETEHGAGGRRVVSPETAVDRALDIEHRILALVDSGKFNLCGYVSYQRIDETGISGVCAGCAVGALAYSLGCDISDERLTAHSVAKVHCSAVKEGLCSRAEVFQLEMGFEELRQIARCDGEILIKADLSDPFYAVGQRLRKKISYSGHPFLSLEEEEWNLCNV